MTLVVALLSVRAIVQVLRVPPAVLVPSIAVLCVLGSYAIRNTFFDSATMLLFGVVGYLMNRYDFPVVPLIIGLVLGGELEEQLRLSLTLSGGDPAVFLRQPIAAGLLLLTIAVLVAPAVRAVRQRQVPVR
jgi:putative tricarboxylic transport membrane protein